MDSDTKPRSSVVDRILKTPANDMEPREASKDVRPAVPTPMLDLVLATGEIESFAYAYLTRVSFDPSGTLTLHFGEDKVVIEGRNLRDIRQKVRLHKADEIAEGSGREGDLGPEGAPHVDNIRLVIAEEEEQEHETGRGTGLRKGFIR